MLSLVLGVCALAPAAEAKRTLYVGGVFGPGVAAMNVGGDGALSPGPGSPFGPDATNGVALTPDGAHLYSPSAGFDHILVFDVNADGSLTEKPKFDTPGTSPDPTAIAISPDGAHAWVTDGFEELIRIFTIAGDGALQPVGVVPLPGADFTEGVAVTPNGDYLYVTTSNPPARIYGFSIGTNGTLTPLATPFLEVPTGAEGLSVTPDGRHLYVTAAAAVLAYAIGADGSLTAVPGSPFATGAPHHGLAVSPTGERLYVTNDGEPGAVEAFAIAADGSLTAEAGTPFAAADETIGIAVTPDGSHVYSGSDIDKGNISAFELAPGGGLLALPGSPFASGVGLADFQGLAVSPNQPPRAAFTATQVGRGNAVAFDTAAAADPDGSIARYDWEFGDGTALADGGPAPTHVYPGPGTYTATLTLTDDEGCSTSFVFTGQTASCNGSAVARVQHRVEVVAAASPPTLHLLVPKRQRLRGALLVRASCDAPCAMTLRGHLLLRGGDGPRRAKLRPTSKQLSGGAPVRVKVKLPPRSRRAAKSTLLLGGKVRAKLSAFAVDSAGGRSATVPGGTRLVFRPR